MPPVSSPRPRTGRCRPGSLWCSIPYLQRRTAVRVVRTLHERGLALPRRDRDGQTCWRRTTIPEVTTMIKNPAYAGSVVYGRTQMGTRRRGEGRTKYECRSLEEWKIVVKDKYPAF